MVVSCPVPAEVGVELVEILAIDTARIGQWLVLGVDDRNGAFYRSRDDVHVEDGRDRSVGNADCVVEDASHALRRRSPTGSSHELVEHTVLGLLDSVPRWSTGSPARDDPLDEEVPRLHGAKAQRSLTTMNPSHPSDRSR